MVADDFLDPLSSGTSKIRVRRNSPPRAGIESFNDAARACGWQPDLHRLSGRERVIYRFRERCDFSPSLADRLARSNTGHTVEEIAAKIADVIRRPAAA